MEPITPPHHNLNLEAPQNMENCEALKVVRYDGQITSLWQFTEEELAQLFKNGGKVFLTVHSNWHPPVRLSTEQPYKVELEENK